MRMAARQDDHTTEPAFDVSSLPQATPAPHIYIYIYDNNTSLSIYLTEKARSCLVPRRLWTALRLESSPTRREWRIRPSIHKKLINISTKVAKGCNDLIANLCSEGTHDALVNL